MTLMTLMTLMTFIMQALIIHPLTTRNKNRKKQNKTGRLPAVHVGIRGVVCVGTAPPRGRQAPGVGTDGERRHQESPLLGRWGCRTYAVCST